MATLTGLHVAFYYAGGRGFGNSQQPLLNSLGQSETLAATGVTSIKAPDNDSAKGAPIARISASVDGWFAVGKAPDATDTARRDWIAAGSTLEFFVTGGDKVAWADA